MEEFSGNKFMKVLEENVDGQGRPLLSLRKWYINLAIMLDKEVLFNNKRILDLQYNCWWKKFTSRTKCRVLCHICERKLNIQQKSRKKYAIFLLGLLAKINCKRCTVKYLQWLFLGTGVILMGRSKWERNSHFHSVSFVVFNSRIYL